MNSDFDSSGTEPAERPRRGRPETYHGRDTGQNPSAGEAPDEEFGRNAASGAETSGANVGRHPAEEGRDRRRTALLEQAERDRIPGDVAELVYDIAQEEGLEPAVALELVRTGLSVSPDASLDGPEAPVADRYLPSWVLPGDDDQAALRRERALRTSFRRFRGLLEAEGEVDVALRRFAAEPDVAPFEY